jgi:DNA polymerase-3 subunit delta'
VSRGAAAAGDDDDRDAPHPRESAVLVGHAEAEQIMLEAYRGGRIPHAWLIGGPHGVGKATLAYRLARFVLAHPDPGAPDVQAAQSLALSPEHPMMRRIVAQSHGDLLILQRTVGDTGKLRTRIAVDDVRRSVGFFGSSAGEGGWRVAIVDSVDEMNKESANALLKVLEEPPPKALLLLVSHASGRVLPTIRSRCRDLTLRGLSMAEVVQAAAQVLGRDPGDEDLREAAAAADGSVGRTIQLLGGTALALRRRVLGMLDALPAVDPQALHALGDQLAGTEPEKLSGFVDTVNEWLARRLAATRAGTEQGEKMQLVRLAEAWERINTAARDAEAYNLDRKPLVFSVFGWLAAATRR